MNSNFEYYKIFYYVAKYENLTKAATVLKTSQPAVTRTIHKLENELGCRLFTRSKTGMQLTPEGRTFYGYVAAGCAQFFKGENDLSNLISLENGTIYISATETALHCYLFQAMEEFNSLYPNVRFKILNNHRNSGRHQGRRSDPEHHQAGVREVPRCSLRHSGRNHAEGDSRTEKGCQ